MKRLLFALILLIVMIGVMLVYIPRPFDSYASLFDGQVEIFCTYTDINSVDVGFGHIVSCNSSDYLPTVNHCKGIDGVSVAFYGNCSDIIRLVDCFNLTNVSTQSFSELTVICGYSDKIRGYVYVDGKKSNIQLAYRNGVITVGSPLILGSY